MRLPRQLDPAIAAIAAWLCFASVLHAQTSDQPPPSEAAAQAQLQQQLQEQNAHLAAVQAQAANAAALQKQQQDLTTQRIAAAAKLRDLDDAVAQATEQMGDLRAQATSAQAARDNTVRALGPLLPLIERLSLYPSETLLAAPETTNDAVRGLMAAKGLSRLLGNQAAAWRAQQAHLDQTEAALDRQSASLAAARAAQSAAAADLDGQIAAANAATQTANRTAQREQALASQAAARAGTLRGLIANLAAQRAAFDKSLAARQQSTSRAAAELAARIAGTPKIVLGRNSLLMPVAGKLVRGFGAETGAGPSTGLTLEAAPNARVIAPCSGTVVFADSFRSFGQMVILDCGNSIHFVLAGLAKLDVAVGHGLRAGEPVGTMPDWNDATAVRPGLYLELGRGGQPINPSPYLTPAG